MHILSPYSFFLRRDTSENILSMRVSDREREREITKLTYEQFYSL